MAEPKTKPTRASVKKFIDGIADESRRQDCVELMNIMKTITKQEPAMWGPSIVGFGTCRYQYIKRLDGIHLPTLKKLIRKSVSYVKKKSV